MYACVLTLSLHVSHRDAGRMTARTAADRDEFLQPVRVQHAGCQALHAAHARADARIQPFDLEMVEQPELRAHHVMEREDGETRAVVVAAPALFLSARGIDARRTRGAVASAQHVRADDEVPVRVERFARPDELLPPAWFGVGGGAVCVAGCG